MTEISNVHLAASVLSTSRVSEWLNGKNVLHTYNPLSADSKGVFSFSARGAGGLISWSVLSSSNRSFAVNLDDKNFMLCCAQRSQQEIGIGSKRYLITPKNALVTSADRCSLANLSAGTIGEGFWIPRHAIEKAFVDTFERYIPNNFEFSPVVDLRNGPGGHLLQLLRLFRDSVCGGDNLKASPIALASFIETICLSMLQNLHHSALKYATPVRAILPAQIRRALEFARTYADTPITVSDMAAAAGVSVRALQVNFQRFLGETPISYLRILRLEGARAEILRASQPTTIAQIARRWGFVHLGRFSQEYRSTYGVLPSRDLSEAFRLSRKA